VLALPRTTAHTSDKQIGLVKMADSERSYLLDCWDEGICPYCRKSFPPQNRVGTGSKEKGGFCSLDCYTRSYELEI
jgi:hypothetical protein